ncbi:hypothetical protein Hypma_013582 [Hypsizygus marmoreus]|uniref:Uncharacterized protein n=1 Tax=Hypsizygus marmoreus TaxID=39966 RepID=A0A369JC60_HYPMA|nr:hypothetical protein Hypma_013582 [Hypsizygus marmoreus]
MDVLSCTRAQLPIQHRPLPPSHDDTTHFTAINFPTHSSSKHRRSFPPPMQVLAPLSTTLGTNNTDTAISTYQHIARRGHVS